MGVHGRNEHDRDLREILGNASSASGSYYQLQQSLSTRVIIRECNAGSLYDWSNHESEGSGVALAPLVAQSVLTGIKCGQIWIS